MEITFWGTRGSIAVPGPTTFKYGGNTCCVELTLGDGSRIIIDAGTGIRPLGEKIIRENSNKSLLLLITHIHWDHLMGFPFFVPAYINDYLIEVDGFHTCMKGLKFVFQNKMLDGVFPITFEQLKAKVNYLGKLAKDKKSEYKGISISCMELNHPQGGFGFKFKEDKKEMVFLTDNELRRGSWKGRSFDDYVNFVKDVNLLIHDAQYTYEEYTQKNGWGHSYHEIVLELAQKAGVEKLIFFHHDPKRNDSELDKILQKISEDEKKWGFSVDAAREGETIVL